MRNISVLLGVLLLLLGCSDNSTNPTNKRLTNDIVKGNYTTIAFSLTENGSTTNIFAEGGFININLSIDSTTTGQFFIPRTITGDSLDINLSLQGRYIIVNDSVSFQQNADTFIKETKWAFQENKLTGKYSSPTTNIYVQLGK